MLRDKIIAEAIAQREQLQAGSKIPAELRKYARIAGLSTFGLCAGGAVLVFALGWHYGKVYYMAVLFLAVLAVMGLLQAIVGRHILTKR